MKLVDDWKDSWKWISTHCMLFAATVQGVWASLPDDMRESLPQSVVSGLTIAILILGVLGRLIDQPRKINNKE